MSVGDMPNAAGKRDSLETVNPGLAFISTNEQHPPQVPQQAFVVEQPAPALGPRPTMITCPSCHEKNFSRIEYANTSKTHLIAVILCVTTCCCCIPYCIDSCKGTNHYCTHCGAYLGAYNN